jgi:hypothetical protein
MIAKAWKPKDPSAAFFPVKMRSLYMKKSSEKPVQYSKLPRHLAVVDVEKHHSFAVVTDDYQLVTNEEAYNRATEIMKKVFYITTMDDMVCLNVTMPKTRSFCHIDLIHKTANFSPWENDKWTAFLRITNSYNRTHLLRYELGFCRWICLNGMIFGPKSVEYSYAHTRRGIDRVDRFVENIGDIHKLELQLTERLHQLQRYYVPETNMLGIFCRAFDVKATEEVMGKPKRSEELKAVSDQVYRLSQSYYSEMGPHAYAVLNVLTDYATRPEGVIAPETRMHALQQKCGSRIDDFISAIQRPDFSFDSYIGDYRQTAEIFERL